MKNNTTLITRIRIERPKQPTKPSTCVDLRYRTDSVDNKVCERAKEQAIAKYPAYKQLERLVNKHTYLSERVCADYLK